MRLQPQILLISLAGSAWVALLAGGLIAQETPRATVRGVVVSAETGRPVPKAAVAARGVERPWWRDLRADEHGRFEIRDVPAGLAVFTAHGNVHQMRKELRFILRESPRNRVTLRAEPVPPFVRVRTEGTDTRRSIFTPDEPVALQVTGYSARERLTVAVRRLSVEELRQNKQTIGWGSDFRVPRELGTPVREQVFDPVGRDAEGRVVQELRLELPPGLYSVWASLRDAADGIVVSVTRIGLVTKFDGRRVRGYVQDLVDNQPVPGAQVEVFSAGRMVASGTTDTLGLFTGEVPTDSGSECKAVAQLGDSVAFTESFVYYEGDAQGEYRVYLYTDRPVYRPGQRVYFKGIARERRGSDYRVPARQRVRLQVEDAGESTILEREYRTNEFGAFAGELELDASAAVGTCTMTVTMRGQEDSGYFFVAEYRKPEYEVTVKPARSHLERGEPAAFTVTARYYWGEPVRNAAVTYSVRRTPEWYYPDDEESRFLAEFYPTGSGEEEDYAGDYGEESDYGEGVTDANGQLIVRVVPHLAESDTQDYRYSLEATLGDESRFQVTAHGSALVTRGAFRLEMTPQSWVVAPGEAAELKVRAVDYEGRPQPHVPVAIEAGGREVTRLALDASGAATLSVPTARQGTLELRATAADASGNRVEERESVWVTDGSFSSEEFGYAGLEVVSDRSAYRPGDTAKILVNVERPGGYALFTVEGDRLFEHRLLPLTAKTTLVWLPIGREYLPNVYISVVTVQGRRFDHQEKMLRVSPKEYALNVSVTADRPKLHPQEAVTFTVRTTDGRGRPVDADVSFGLVDEAIYAIQPDRALDGIQYFYRYQQNQVDTSYSWPEIYLADEPKDGGPRDVRKDFPDTARWIASLRTGPRGVAKVRVRLPDSLTTWRATVRAHTRATQVGAGIAKVVCSKDLFVRLESPRFFTQNDRSLVSTIVHNDTPRAQRVHVRLTASGVRLDDARPREIEVAPSGSLRVDWPLTATAAGSAAFTAYAASASGPRDGVERSVPVVPHGTESRAGASGELEGTSTELALPVPAGAIAGATSAQVSLSASPAAVILEALDYLHAEDYGTTESAVGWFLPDMTQALTFKKLGVRYRPLEERVGPAVKRNLERLYDLQTYNSTEGERGGWGWSAGAEEEPFWTAYALYGLVQAEKAGYAVDEEVSESGRKALVRLLPREQDPSNRALICYVLARAGHTAAKEMADLERRLPELQGKVKNYAIALLALALSETDLLRARGVAAWLKRTVKEDGRTAHWPEIYPWGFYSCNDNETTGYAMMALIRTDPTSPLIEKAARWLIAKRQGGGWASTEDTASITYALGEYLLLQRRVSPPDYTATVRVDGQEIGRVKVTATNMFRPHVVPIPPALLRPGSHTVRIERAGRGRLLYGASMKTHVQGEDFGAEVSGLSVKREYFRRLRARDNPGTRIEKMVPAGRNWRSGEEIFVRMTVEVHDPERRGECREVVLRDPLPAGCEAIDEPARDEYGMEYPDSSGDWWSFVEERRELRDREAVFFSDRLRKGKNSFHYRIRTVQPGDYHVLSARAAALYIPEISGRSEETRVRIRD